MYSVYLVNLDGDEHCGDFPYIDEAQACADDFFNRGYDVDIVNQVNGNVVRQYRTVEG